MRNQHSGVRCPFCGSGEVQIEQEKGVSICRATYYCIECSQPFEKLR